ncbi:MAG: bi-domain-containing oxidoreductase [Proteobacteria bacterium]|nr:bi-domain-containing oxidoreductase [Pseudomonadota bacterium]
MRQVQQSLKTGVTEVIDAPAPALRPHHVLIETRKTLISAGTERMLVAFGQANLLQKARQQPERVRQVLHKARTDGVLATVESVRAKLDAPLPLGYCNVGTVLEVGRGVTGLQPGDRVVSNGPHAELVCVPALLCAKVPAGVEDEPAAFTVLGAIALQSIRLANPTLGEHVVVTGLGLLGLLAVQLLRATGCRVLGLDFSSARCELARQLGAEVADLSSGADALGAAAAFSQGRGVDAVIVAAATKESSPMLQAAEMCRKRGRIVMVGATGLQLERTPFYEKELSFQVSCSYGPGRYDPSYEDQGRDYPLPYVRWTAQRNFEAILGLLETQTLTVGPMVTDRFAINEASRAYELVAAGDQATLGIVLDYPAATSVTDAQGSAKRLRSLTVGPSGAPPLTEGKGSDAVVGIIGAGGFTGLVMLPALVRAGAQLRTIASSGGFDAAHLARKFHIPQVTTDSEELLNDPRINTVVITTRHDSHAEFTRRALAAGKHVLVEKPLALDAAGLERVAEAYASAVAQTGRRPVLMVGFNRRFAPLAVRLRQTLASAPQPKALVMAVNAGAIPADHWTQDALIGGGRIIGEGCHFIDLLRFLVGAPIVGVQAEAMATQADTVSFTLRFGDGSLGTVHYFANGHKAVAKERLEVFCAGRILQLDNFRSLAAHGWPGFKTQRLLRQDKGHRAEVGAFVEAIRKGAAPPVPIEELIEITRASFAIDAIVRAGVAPARPFGSDPVGDA